MGAKLEAEKKVKQNTKAAKEKAKKELRKLKVSLKSIGSLVDTMRENDTIPGDLINFATKKEIEFFVDFASPEEMGQALTWIGLAPETLEVQIVVDKLSPEEKEALS